MSGTVESLHNKKYRRVVFGSVSLLTLLVASGLGLSVYAWISEAYDRVH